MRILVICIGGISTNVLVNRLNTFAQTNGKQDVFRAVNIHSYEDLLNESDVILLAPQAKLFLSAILEKSKDKQIPVFMLDEKDFSFSDMSRIYEAIPRISPDLDIVQQKKHQLDIAFLKYVLINMFISLAIIISLGMIPLLLMLWIKSELITALYQVTLGTLSIYLCLSVGYFSGKYMGVNCLVTSLIALGASLLIYPMNGVGQVTVAGNVQILTSYIDLKNWGLYNAPVILILSLLASVIFILAYQKDVLKDKLPSLHPQMVSYIASVLPSTLVISIFLIIRLFLVWIS